MAWRWMDTGAQDGALQMATDQALIQLAGSHAPTVRVYRWQPTCISLGNHQPLGCIDTERCALEGVDVARRPTGGRAVYHAEELTYAVVIPKEDPCFSESVSAVYGRISRGLCSGIRSMGIPAELTRRQVDLHSHYRTEESVSCFSAAARNEVMIEGRKLIGSAQRQLAWGLLQHGSILIGEAHLSLPRFLSGLSKEKRSNMREAIAAKTVTLSGFCGRQVGFEEVSRALKKGLSEEFHVDFEETQPSLEEKKLALSLRPEYSLFESGS